MAGSVAVGYCSYPHRSVLGLPSQPVLPVQVSPANPFSPPPTALQPLCTPTAFSTAGSPALEIPLSTRSL